MGSRKPYHPVKNWSISFCDNQKLCNPRPFLWSAHSRGNPNGKLERPSRELVGKEVVYLIDVTSTPINMLPQDELQVDYLMALSVGPIEYLNNKRWFSSRMPLKSTRFFFNDMDHWIGS